MFPFLTSYDPPGSSEGSLDPLGLYQVADQLAVQLVPAIRERMQRIRFLTAMVVGALVTEGLEDNPRNRDASPYLVWEWLVVESFIRALQDDDSIWGVPGTLMANRAVDQHGYLDARSYLKTPRIFGFHGVYKRLANHLGLLDVHLRPGPNADGLLEAWAKDRGASGIQGVREILSRWTRAVERSFAETPPRTKPNWSNDTWAELAAALDPSGCRGREKRCLRDLLLASDQGRMAALPALWELQSDVGDSEIGEETLHDKLEQRVPSFKPLLHAIREYEGFARGLQDAFDVLRSEAAKEDAKGYLVTDVSTVKAFGSSIKRLDQRFTKAHDALGVASITNTALQNIFAGRFKAFSAPMDSEACAVELCKHHEEVQRRKSATGKRAWFDRIGPDRIYIRHGYRETPDGIQPGRYVHTYRSRPVRLFSQDLS